MPPAPFTMGISHPGAGLQRASCCSRHPRLGRGTSHHCPTKTQGSGFRAPSLAEIRLPLPGAASPKDSLPVRPAGAATAAAQPSLGPGIAQETRPPTNNRKVTLMLNGGPRGPRHREAAAWHRQRALGTGAGNLYMEKDKEGKTSKFVKPALLIRLPWRARKEWQPQLGLAGPPGSTYTASLGLV